MLEKLHGPSAQRLSSPPEIRGLQMGVDLSLQPLCIGGQGPKVAQVEMPRTMAWVPGQSVYFPQDAWCPNKTNQNIYPKRDTPNTWGERHDWDMINANLSLPWETLRVCVCVY